MKLTDKQKIEIEKKCGEITSELASYIEEKLQPMIEDSEIGGVMQSIIYSQLASLYIAVHLYSCELRGGNNKAGLIGDILYNSDQMFLKCRKVKETH